ncbi:MAG: PRC-barrel domain-containing protein [Solirubrobacteraceae bacterium]
MSSGGEGETFKIGAHVDATDGRCGRLTRVIFDPIADALTDLVVEPGHHKEMSRLVPLKLVSHVDADLIRLSCTKEQFERLDQAEEIQFLPANETTLGYGANGASWPYYALAVPLGHDHVPMFSDRVPLGDVEIRRGDPVHAKDGLIGAVQGLVIDPADYHVTHVILQEGHVWRRKQVAIPIGVANRAAGELRVDLTKDEIEALPPVSLRSHS